MPAHLVEEEGIHLNVGSPTMGEFPELESGRNQLGSALLNRDRKVKVFISGELETAYEFELITLPDLQAFQNECHRLDALEEDKQED